MAWRENATGGYNTLECISHLLRGEHSTHPDVLRDFYRWSGLGGRGNENGNGNGNAQPQAFDRVARALLVYGAGDSHEDMVEAQMPQVPLANPNPARFEQHQVVNQSFGFSLNANTDSFGSNSSGFHDNFHPSSSHQEQNRALEMELERLSISTAAERLDYPEWFLMALRGQANPMPHQAGPSSPPAILPFIEVAFPPQPPPVNRPGALPFFNPIRREDPMEFHLNAFDSPPPSPELEAQEFAMHMQVDPNGIIPVLPAEYMVEQNLPTPPTDNFACTNEFCKSLDQFLLTTEDNVKDKKNVIKELFNHATRVLKTAAELAPADRIEALVDLSASVALLYNSFGDSEDLESFQQFAITAAELVATIQVALGKQLHGN